MHMQMDPITGQPGDYVVLNIPPEVIQAALQQSAAQLGLQAGAPGYAAGALPFVVNNQTHGSGPVPYPYQQMYNVHSLPQHVALQPLILQGHVPSPPQQLMGQAQQSLPQLPMFNLQAVQSAQQHGAQPTGPYVPALYGPQFDSASLLSSPQQSPSSTFGSTASSQAPQGLTPPNAFVQPQYVYNLQPIQPNVQNFPSGLPIHAALQPAGVATGIIQPQTAFGNLSRYQAVLQPIPQAGLQAINQTGLQAPGQVNPQPIPTAPYFFGHYIAEPCPGFGFSLIPQALPCKASTEDNLHGGHSTTPKDNSASHQSRTSIATPCKNCKEPHHQ